MEVGDVVFSGYVDEKHKWQPYQIKVIPPKYNSQVESEYFPSLAFCCSAIGVENEDCVCETADAKRSLIT